MPKKKLLQGAIILSAAGIICRALGVVLRIPLANIVGNYGIGLYQLVFPLYSLLLIVSSAGIPVAMAKMIARVRDDRLTCKKILVNALVALMVLGAVITLLFLLLARPLATWQGKAEIWPLYLAIAPAVFFVCIIAALRGYFQGLNNMLPTGISQITEQVVKVAVALGLALWLIKYGVLAAVLGAIIAVSVSELVAMLLLIIWYRRQVRHQARLPKTKLLSWSVMKNIFVMALPIMVMSLTFPVVLLFDSFFIVNALKSAGVNNATELYGIASGAVHTLINLPTVVGIAIGTVLLPLVARSFQQKKPGTWRRPALTALWITLGYSLAAALALFLLPRLILNCLYHHTFAGHADELKTAVLLLRIESWAVVLICLTQVISSILQGVDQARWPMFALMAGGISKIIFEIVCLKRLGIMAVSMANVLCFGLALVVDSIVLIKFLRQRQ